MTPPYAPRVGDSITTLDTPSMIVDLDIMERNIARLMGRLLPTGVRVRPHLKTTKSTALAKRMVSAGATGGCVAKLSEAEAMAAAGFDDLLITCEIIGPAKVRRLVALHAAHPGRIMIVVDSAAGADAIDAALAAADPPLPPIPVLIDVDVGLHRTGVPPGKPALALARHVADTLPRLHMVGLQGYEGHLQHVHSRAEREAACRAAMADLVATAALLRGAGLDMGVVTTGGTGTAEFCASVPGVTEVQPGSFIFMDTDYRAAVGGDVFAYSLTILATVLSLQGTNSATIDTGLKSLTTDSGLAQCKDPRYTYACMGDEHGALSWDDSEGTPPLNIGDRVEMVPSHIDPTVNLHDVYYAHRDGVIEEIWPVDTRGKVQ
ncbi:hypothetical protein B0T26DRAFT_669642 [Lasiosphaeria miniovina]|uniref:D-serine dehydratase-like domain-containing protein n=1 Tax=Lasiosphaeria miniovina TaxID=1954250 RepID=A0AA40BFD4_9PEZI|nr:uncharacterized protein B0T26DRAFT_669642 [Lasiosphaeria miniovina]KAK0733215.1 hypothetical protein B0T26DRAFT_669642 [Lasiosphaeria miniovina]